MILAAFSYTTGLPVFNPPPGTSRWSSYPLVGTSDAKNPTNKGTDNTADSAAGHCSAAFVFSSRFGLPSSDPSVRFTPLRQVQMQVVASTEGLNLQYAVIGRLKQGHNAFGLALYQIRGIIAFELNGLVDEMDIIHVPPNYIICLNTAHAQTAFLHQSVLKTNSFELELLAWCKEHELSQLPWITGVPAKISEIPVDPLRILPVIPKKANNVPASVSDSLKSSFAAKIPKKYDLHAPDLSYLLIVELEQYYNSKGTVLEQSKQLISAVLDTIHGLHHFAETNIEEAKSRLRASHPITAPNILHDRYTFINALKTAVSPVETVLDELSSLASQIMTQTEPRLDLRNFTAGPPTTEIPTPVSYADRLKQIYVTVMKKLHRVVPIIETIKREENRYETYITVDGFTARYYGQHHKTASAMEAAAVYYKLKHITNVQGYRIIDLNFPILERLVLHLNIWNVQMNQLQQFMDTSLQTMQIVHQNVLHESSSTQRSQLHIESSEYLKNTSSNLEDKTETSYATITDLCHTFQTYKAQYHAIHMDIYSPTRSWYPWSWTARPLQAP